MKIGRVAPVVAQLYKFRLDVWIDELGWLSIHFYLKLFITYYVH